MNLFNRKTFETCFWIICVIGVTCMIGYWLYKFEIDDRDIGVVDYKSFEEAKDDGE